MPNFDLIVSVSKTSINTLIADYHANPPSKNNPFLMATKTLLPSGSEVDVFIGITGAPVVTFEKPNINVWNAAQARDGRTNGDAQRPIPALAMLQFQIPTLAVTMTVGKDVPVSGQANNSIGHLTVDFTGDNITLLLVAVTVDKTKFDAVDAAIFNAAALPAIFDMITNILPVINIPSVDLSGTDLNSMRAMLIENNLLVCTTLKTNQHPLDLSGLAMPLDPTFVLVSEALIGELVYSATSPYRQFPYSKHGSHQSALDYQFNAIVSLDATVESITPLVCSGTASAQLELDVFLSDETMEEAVGWFRKCATFGLF